ncbi:MAG TPA: XdhC/CoxI family protein [Fimbriimonadaceae bacterium]|nr:XdhC/CoxI family protein [Fimbriimonadaceae bacterium]
MRDVAEAVLAWGQPYALAVLVEVKGSAPRPLGSTLAVRQDGLTVGSVSGGCVEARVAEVASEVIQTGQPQFLRFAALGEDELWEVGLSCSGEIAVSIFRPEVQEWSGFWSSVINRQEDSRSVPFPEGEFVYRNEKPARLLILGAVHIATHLVPLGRVLGFDTVVIDPRAALASSERFPIEPDQFVHAWPSDAVARLGLEANDFAVLLTHDPKLDMPFLRELLVSEVRYIGALGSRKTQQQRLEALRAEGFSEEQLARIRGPVGLSIGAKTAEEIAVSIAAELIQVRHQ